MARQHDKPKYSTMWGMEYTHNGNLVTLRSHTPSVRFRVIGESQTETRDAFETFAVPNKQRSLPVSEDVASPFPDIKPQNYAALLFNCYYKRQSDRRRQGGRNHKHNEPKLSESEVGRFLRTFHGGLSAQRVATMVSSATGAVVNQVGRNEFNILCSAYLPVIPCLDYLLEYLEADADEVGIINGSVAAQLLERHGFLEAARWLRRRKEPSATPIAYPQLLHLMGLPSCSPWSQRSSSGTTGTTVSTNGMAPVTVTCDRP
ncbi:hypothetical protein BOX15_Mlig002670g1 [Macrostomum lignano]|uniref:Uncharacterized protein n=2 Tax=Macrostomum lignano TaxID=282301 RepID=A0A267DCP3_9PLAT|nr:hypothetical protein BOX15_Mlig021981g1 [Macrostomum lignano]PAA49539.1 hypothetical protein BOX15_Mlig002670g2 [Macrostomum lignano]PAA58964.1 hypothetical protein BOX15_Mlig002670g1 [Macrostomum lignano]